MVQPGHADLPPVVYDGASASSPYVDESGPSQSVLLGYPQLYPQASTGCLTYLAGTRESAMTTGDRRPVVPHRRVAYLGPTSRSRHPRVDGGRLGPARDGAAVSAWRGKPRRQSWGYG